MLRITTVTPRRVPALLAASSPARASTGRAFSAAPTHRSHAPIRLLSSGFTGIYEVGQPINGPLGGASLAGAPRILPKELKHHLDQYVVGQERAKKKLSTAIYNHYQRIEDLRRREDEKAREEAQARRRAMAHRHPVEGSLSFIVGLYMYGD